MTLAAVRCTARAAALAVVSVMVACSQPPTVGPTQAESAGPSTTQVEARGVALALGRARGKALQADDEPAWVATGSDRATFARMRLLRVADYSVVEATTVGEAVGSTPTAPRWLVTVRLGFRLGDLAASTRTARVEWLLAQAGTTWVVADERGIEGLPLWQLQGLTVDHEEGLVVVGTGSAAERAAVRSAATAARHRVVDACGRLGLVLVVAPATTSELEQLTGQPLASGDVAGLTQGPLDPTGRANGDSVYVVPRSVTRITDVGLVAILAHEMTHVAMRSRAPGRVPLWLEEGLAQEVAYADPAIDRAALLKPLSEQVARRGLPQRLPTDFDLDAAAPDVQASYLAAWRVVHVLARRRGLPAVVAMYVTCAARIGATDGCAADIEKTFDLRPVDLLTRWRADLRALASGHLA